MNLREFVEWANAQISVDIPENNTVLNGRLKGQCVSLIGQYLYQVFNKSFQTYGHARDWDINYPKDVLKRVDPKAIWQRGDVLVYGSNFGLRIWTYGVNR